MKKLQSIIQGTYMFLYFFMSIGICGNIELGVKTSKTCWIAYRNSLYFNMGKNILC